MTPFETPADARSTPGYATREVLESLAAIRGEGDEWDFKETLGDLTQVSVRVNLAKDALAFCNLADGGTLIIGITDDYSRVGLRATERVDTTTIRRSIEKYIDGEFTVTAAEHELIEDDGQLKRYGIVHFARRTAQPVLAAVDGQIGKGLLFRSGDILIRRGAQSIRANSGDVRRLLTNSTVEAARVRAVEELWTCAATQRHQSAGVETLYDLLIDTEYPDVASNPGLRHMLDSTPQLQHATDIGTLQKRVRLVRPYIPDDLYEQYIAWSAFVGRVQMKAIQQVDSGILRPWTELDDGSPDAYLHALASRLVVPEAMNPLWAGQTGSSGTYRPLKPMIDIMERVLLDGVRGVLRGVA